MILSDFLYVGKWLLLLLFLQISLYFILYRSVKKLAIAFSFTASFLLAGLVSFYLVIFHITLEYTLLFFLFLFGIGLYISKPTISMYKGTFHYYAIFTLFFTSMLIFKIVNPDILGGEKFMEYTILHSMYRFPQIPPVDLWYGGAPFNVYYYYGYWLFASLGSIVKIPPQILFNLILPTIFALSAVNILAIGKIVLKKYFYIPLIVFFIPNIYFIYAFIVGKTSFEILNLSIFLIPGTRDEFTLSSFLLSDIHPHVIAFILQTFIILILVHSIKNWKNCTFTHRIIIISLLSLSIGAIFPINAWNILIFIPFIIITGLIISSQYLNFSRVSLQWIRSSLVACYHMRMRQIINIFGTRTSYSIPIFWVIIPVLGIILYLPYYLQDNSQSLSLALVYTPSPIIPFLLMWGIIFCGLIWTYREQIITYPWVTIILIPGVILGNPSFSIIGVLFLYACIRRKNIQDILIILSLSSIMFCELFYLNDNLFEANYRLNTVFKMYSSAWLLLGIAILIEIGQYYEKIENVNCFRVSRAGTYIITMIIITGLLCLPFLGFYLNGMSSKPGLRGDLFLENSYPADADAINFLRNLTGYHLIIEPADYYNDETIQGRISAFSGIPTLIGQYQHEMLWRQHQEGTEAINQRVIAVQLIYEHPDIALYLMDQYGANLLYVGPGEKRLFNVSLPEFGLDVIYNSNDVQIYKRNSTIYSKIPDNYQTSIKIQYPDYNKINEKLQKSYSF